MSDGYARLSLSDLAAASGFRASNRFADWQAVPVLDAEPELEEAAAPIRLEPEIDPVSDAFMKGYAQGLDVAREEAAVTASANDASAAKLALSFARLDAALEEELRQRLRDTVVALCESVIAPLALDGDALARRIARATSMLARADDERVVRVNPEDLELLSPTLLAQWTVEPDISLERGQVRIEGANGGVEDGPATWRRAIAEALHQC